MSTEGEGQHHHSLHVTSPRSDEAPGVCGQCRLGQFRCVASGQCISETRRCDGTQDCPDNSDEDKRSCNFAEGLNLRTYPSRQNITEGREVVFQCRDEGPLRAEVGWSRGNGLPLPPGSRDTNGRLEMPNIQVYSSTCLLIKVYFITSSTKFQIIDILFIFVICKYIPLM